MTSGYFCTICQRPSEPPVMANLVSPVGSVSMCKNCEKEFLGVSNESSDPTENLIHDPSADQHLDEIVDKAKNRFAR